MKRNEHKSINSSAANPSTRNHQIITRLDESLPLETDEWVPVERLLVRLTEFAPTEMLVELSTAIASFADDQARRGYILGQEDMYMEVARKIA